MSTNFTLRVQDTATASYLAVKGWPYKTLVEGNVCVFYFQPEAEQAIAEYLSGAQCSAHQFASTLQAMKRAVYETLRRVGSTPPRKPVQPVQRVPVPDEDSDSRFNR